MFLPGGITYFLFYQLGLRRGTRLCPESKITRRRSSRRLLLPWTLTRTCVFDSGPDKLEAVDHVCFAAVCKEWRALSKAYNLTTKRWSKQIIMVPMHALDPWGTKAKTVQCLWRKNLRQHSLISPSW